MPLENRRNFAWPRLSEQCEVPDRTMYWLFERRKHFTDQEKKDAWDAVSSVVRTYSDEMVKRWIEEMDTLLVYAGIFSAVLTAFNVQSYALLTPAGPDPVLDALQRISEQLSSASVNPPFVNSTAPAWQQSGNTAQPSPEQWAVWLNALWFSSLVCSLSSASVAIMVKQWLSEYKTGISGNSRQTARLRQYRLEGLIKWRVGTIITVLPLLLQISLGLFLTGLLILLWNLNQKVALAVSTLVGVLVLFTIITSILPVIKSDCSYQTPISLSLFYIRLPLRSIKKRCFRMVNWLRLHAQDWSRTAAILDALKNLLKSSEALSSLRATEGSHVQNTSRILDCNMFAMAYTTTLDLSHLEHGTICFSDMETEDVSRIFDRIDAENQQHRHLDDLGQVPSWHWTLEIPRGMAYDVLLAKCLRYSPPEELSSMRPYFNAKGTTDAVGSNQWNHSLSSCLVTLQHCNDRLDPAFWSHVLEYSWISKIDTLVEDHKIEEKTLNSVAALSYKALQVCNKSRYKEWFRDYTQFLYVLAACTQAITRQSKKEDKHHTRALHDAVKAAQSRIIELIQDQQDLDKSQFLVLWRIHSSNLEAVGGISNDMLDAMVKYANSSIVRTLHLEDDVDLQWVMNLKRKRDEAQKKMARMREQSQVILHSAIVPTTLGTPATNRTLARPLEPSAVAAISSMSRSNVQPEENFVVSANSAKNVPIPVSHQAPPPSPTLSLGLTASTQTTLRATVHKASTPAVDATVEESDARETPGKAEDASRTTADFPLAAGPSEPPFDTSLLVGPVHETEDPSADPRSAESACADPCSAKPHCADPSTDVLSADLPRADPHSDSRKADEDPKAEEGPGADKNHETHEHPGPTGDSRAVGELEGGSLALHPAVAEIIEENTGIDPQTRRADVSGGNSPSVGEMEDVEREG